MKNLKPCVCCGHRYIVEYDNYDICPICNWQDESLQSKNPDYKGGPNGMSLNQAKEEWQKKKQAS